MAKINNYKDALEWCIKKEVFTTKELEEAIEEKIIKGLKLTGMIATNSK